MAAASLSLRFKWPGVALTTYLLLAPRLKKE
jgi:hypothetical protein